MTLYVTNAFSINMLLRESGCLKFLPVASWGARSIIEEVGDCVWAIGHADTAHIVGMELIGKPVDANRINIELSKEDTLIVAQYTGPRLPEGAKVLPDGARIEYWTVTHW